MATQDKKSFFGGMIGIGAKSLSNREKALQDAEDTALGTGRPSMSPKWSEDEKQGMSDMAKKTYEDDSAKSKKK